MKGPSKDRDILHSSKSTLFLRSRKKDSFPSLKNSNSLKLWRRKGRQQALITRGAKFREQPLGKVA